MLQQHSIVQRVKYIAPYRIVDANSTENIMKVANSLPFKSSTFLIDVSGESDLTVRIENLSDRHFLDSIFRQNWDRQFKTISYSYQSNSIRLINHTWIRMNQRDDVPFRSYFIRRQNAIKSQYFECPP